MYSIAWEIGQDYRTVAEWNNIRAPYVIRKGQRLKIKAGAAEESKFNTGASLKGAHHRVVAGDTLYSLARTAGVNVRELAKWNNIGPPYVIRPGQELRITNPGNTSRSSRVAKSSPKPGSKSVKGSSKPSKNTKIRKAEKPGGKIRAWGWPTKGRVSKRFGRNGKKGLEIVGKKGQPIRAAAAGKVVYQGSGLRGYGQLVIIKHNQEFLSAYAHCDRIVVREGDVIKKGQQIADMGKTGTNQVKLHFEIRYRGSPVNPEKYLRRR